jgi:hypothetical protein
MDVLRRVSVYCKTEMEDTECSVRCVEMLKDLMQPIAQTIFGINFFSFEPNRDARRSLFAVSY